MEPLTILLVEDNPADVRVASEILEAAGIVHKLHLVTDGDAAVAFLSRTAEFSDAPRPDLVLLDLTLPRRDGREVLAEAKQSAQLREIPVVVLSTSDTRTDRGDALALEADLYLTKPATFADFSVTAQRLSDFWHARRARAS